MVSTTWLVAAEITETVPEPRFVMYAFCANAGAAPRISANAPAIAKTRMRAMSTPDRCLFRGATLRSLGVPVLGYSAPECRLQRTGKRLRCELSRCSARGGRRQPVPPPEATVEIREIVETGSEGRVADLSRHTARAVEQHQRPCQSQLQHALGKDEAGLPQQIVQVARGDADPSRHGLGGELRVGVVKADAAQHRRQPRGAQTALARDLGIVAVGAESENRQIHQALPGLGQDDGIAQIRVIEQPIGVMRKQPQCLVADRYYFPDKILGIRQGAQ